METLSEIANKYNCDKGPQHHNYTPIYSRYFEKWREERFILLELGFGGYHYPDRGGAGARMWADYFPHAHIITSDIHPKNSLNHPRIHFFQAGQNEIDFWYGCFTHAAGCEWPQIIIDDASHVSYLTIESFEILFPKLKPGGIYVVEDVHASYWSEHEFDGTTEIQDLSQRSTMNYFKLLADSMNWEHLRGKEALLPAFYKEIESIHFYKQMIWVFKKA